MHSQSRSLQMARDRMTGLKKVSNNKLRDSLGFFKQEERGQHDHILSLSGSWVTTYQRAGPTRLATAGLFHTVLMCM